MLKVGQGSLYPALYRLERQRFVTSEWRTTENNRRARYYQAHSHRNRRLADERKQWLRMSTAVNMVLAMTEG